MAQTTYAGSGANTYASGSSVSSIPATYTRYLEDGTTAGFSANTTSTQGFTFFNVSKSQTSGGDGYAVGDRLRVVGGTPVPSPHGGITELCVSIPGVGYSSAANVKVYVGDGTTPGSGCTVGSVNLNREGQITSINISNRGSGYSMENPPKVRVVYLDLT